MPTEQGPAGRMVWPDERSLAAVGSVKMFNIRMLTAFGHNQSHDLRKLRMLRPPKDLDVQFELYK